MTKTRAYEIFGEQWAEYLWLELNTVNFKNLSYKIKSDKESGIIICPNKEDIFKAFRMTTLSDVKVVILGQCPFHTTYWNNTPIASGLAFGIKTVIPSVIPPSLKNIVKELEDDLELPCIDFDYTLQSWAKQGVLLLNTALTVQKGNPGSHIFYWQSFIKTVLEVIDTYTSNTVFILWGSRAKSYKQYLTNDTFKYIESSHPSPLSCDKSFIGSKPFSTANSYLKEPINWTKYVD